MLKVDDRCLQLEQLPRRKKRMRNIKDLGNKRHILSDKIQRHGAMAL